MIRDLLSVAQFANETNFTEPQLRWWIFNAANNGMDAHKVVVRIGARRVYIDPAAFDRWIDGQNSQSKAA
jgi:hypothetical protein